jgi:predicted transcriptional regulator
MLMGVNFMYTLPQEIEVWYIIPAIRRELSKNLIKNHGITYEKTGNLLGITKAAVSQYLSNKRARKIKLHPKVEKEIIRSVQRIIANKSNAIIEIQKILKLIRKKGLHCEICGNIIDGKLHNCKQIIPKYFDD